MSSPPQPRAPVGGAELAARLRLPQAVVAELLAELIRWGWVEHVPDGGPGWRPLVDLGDVAAFQRRAELN